MDAEPTPAERAALRACFWLGLTVAVGFMGPVGIYHGLAQVGWLMSFVGWIVCLELWALLVWILACRGLEAMATLRALTGGPNRRRGDRRQA